MFTTAHIFQLAYTLNCCLCRFGRCISSISILLCVSFEQNKLVAHQLCVCVCVNMQWKLKILCVPSSLVFIAFCFHLFICKISLRNQFHEHVGIVKPNRVSDITVSPLTSILHVHCNDFVIRSSS